MATYEYIIIQNHEQSSTRDHYHSVTISAINAAAAANIPRYASILRVYVYLRMKHNRVFGTISNADVNIWLCNNGDDNSGENLCSGESSTSSKEFTAELGEKVDYLYPFTMNTSYSRLAAYYDSTTLRGYSCELFKIVYEYMIPSYWVTFYNYDGSDLFGDFFKAGNTPVYEGPTPTRPSDAEYDYTFSGWSPSLGPITGNTSYTAQYTATKRKYTATFKNADGSVVSTKTIEVGATLGTLPTVSRSGYEFAGWLPCAPAKDLYGNVLDSRYYGGLTSYPLAQDYKYKDKFALHIEAHMSKWSDIEGRQIISCTQGGGWGLGYQAGSETAGRGAEIYSSSGYKIINFGYENFKDNDWYTFDLIFNNGTFEAYVNGEKKGSVSTGSSTLTYNSTNTIFVGAEAGGNTETPDGNYFYGTISNVFIANQGEKLSQPTPSLVVTKDLQFYPIWRKLPTYKVEFLNYDKYLLHTSIHSQGSTPTYTGPTPTKPSDDDYEYEFSGWEPKLGPITNDTSYIAQFNGIKNKYDLIISAQSGGQSDKEGITQDIDYGTEITITAIPDVGYRFVEWGDGNSENPRTFKLKGNTFLYPIFEKDFFSVELIDGQVDLVISGQEKEGKYEYYSNLKISPIKKPGYKFTHWTGEVEEFQGAYFIRVLSDMKIVANYQELNMVFKSVKICYPTENDIVSPDNPVLGGDRVYLEIQVALE